MAGYINPIELIAPYLTPINGSINAGLGLGLNLLKQQNDTAHNNANIGLINQQVAASKAAEARTIADTEAKAAELVRQGKIMDYITGLTAGTPPIATQAPLVLPDNSGQTAVPVDYENPPSPVTAVKATPIPMPTAAIQPQTVRRVPSVAELLSTPGLNFKEFSDFRKQGMTEENQAAINSARDEANRIREQYGIEQNRLRDLYNQARTETDRQKIQNQWDMLSVKIDSMERIAAARDAAKAEKPEYTVKQALGRMSTIKSAISRMNSGSPMDALLMSQLPEYAGAMASADPAVRQSAIDQLNQEYDYISSRPNVLSELTKLKPPPPVMPPTLDSLLPYTAEFPASMLPPPTPKNAPASFPWPNWASKTSQETKTTVGGPKKNANTDALLAEANKAIAAGADPEKVKKRLKDVYGISVK